MQTLSMKNPQEVYLRQGVLTASPLELVVMLYDALRKNMLLAQRAIAKKDANAAHGCLMKSQAIVTELMHSLDMSFAISENLSDIYEFLLHHLEEANIKKNSDMIGEALEIVEELRSAWKDICDSQRGAMYQEAQG